MHIIIIQGYKVYQDPEGTQTLEKNSHSEIAKRNSVTNITNDTTDDIYYKRRIMSLNEEIKTLNDEITMVAIIR